MIPLLFCKFEGLGKKKPRGVKPADDETPADKMWGILEEYRGILEAYGTTSTETRAEQWARWSKEVDARIAALASGERLTALMPDELLDKPPSTSHIHVTLDFIPIKERMPEEPGFYPVLVGLDATLTNPLREVFWSGRIWDTLAVVTHWSESPAIKATDA